MTCAPNETARIWPQCGEPHLFSICQLGGVDCFVVSGAAAGDLAVAEQSACRQRHRCQCRRRDTNMVMAVAAHVSVSCGAAIIRTHRTAASGSVWRRHRRRRRRMCERNRPPDARGSCGVCISLVMPKLSYTFAPASQ